MFAEECGRLISPPCWKTGRYCSGRLRTAPAEGVPPAETPLLQRARAAGLKVYPHTFRNEARRRPTLHCSLCVAPQLCIAVRACACLHSVAPDQIGRTCTA